MFLLDRWSGRLGARPHRNSSAAAKQANHRPLDPGDSCMAAGACKILQIASLGIGTGQLQSGASAYDVGRGSITGGIARLSVGAAMFARATYVPQAVTGTFIAHKACSTHRRAPSMYERASRQHISAVASPPRQASI